MMVRDLLGIGALAAACAAPSSTPSGAGADANACFVCQGLWVCGWVDAGYIEVKLSVAAEGCVLDGAHPMDAPGPLVLAPDGTLSVGGRVVGHATVSGDSVDGAFASGGSFHCRGGSASSCGP
jgi:hypothetical protein